MSKQQKQEHKDGFKEARGHLQRGWRQWLHGKGGTSSPGRQQAMAAAQAACTDAPRVVAFNSFGPLQDPVHVSLHDTPSCRICFQPSIPSMCFVVEH